MRYLANLERAVRGTFDFPIELYYVDKTHPRYEMPFHWHMEHELILVLQGCLHLSVDGETWDLHTGDCALIGDGSIHGGTPENCVYECVVFDLERFLQDPVSVARGYPGFWKQASEWKAIFPVKLQRLVT